MFTPQTLPACDEPLDVGVGKVAGFSFGTSLCLAPAGQPSAVQIGSPADLSLHAGVAARADERKKLERLCRYISRPSIAEKRLSLTPNGNVRYDVKGFTSVAGAWMGRSDPAEDAIPRRRKPRHLTPGILPSALRANLRLFRFGPGDFVEPLDFIARLAALVPKPRVNLTRHGLFAPNSKYRARVTPAKRGRGGQSAKEDREESTPAERGAAMTWAQRLKRVFGIDIETCPACGGAVRIIACIEDPEVIAKILTHLDAKAAESEASRRPPCRAPPPCELFD